MSNYLEDGIQYIETQAETVNSGVTEVRSSVDYILGDGINNLTLTGPLEPEIIDGMKVYGYPNKWNFDDQQGNGFLLSGNQAMYYYRIFNEDSSAVLNAANENKHYISENCGIVSCINIMLMAGIFEDREQGAYDLIEHNVVQEVINLRLCNLDISNFYENTGATTIFQEKAILANYGIESDVFSLYTPYTIADAVKEGKGIILRVNQDRLNNTNVDITDVFTNHSITITGVAYDSNDNLQGFYYCDSGSGFESKFIETIDLMFASSALGGAVLITKTSVKNWDKDLDGTGNELNNELIGNDGNNILRGEGGNDTLIGGKGDDVLIGGTGGDTYIFTNDDITAVNNNAILINDAVVEKTSDNSIWNDTLDFSAVTNNLTIDLLQPNGGIFATGSDVSGIEKLISGSGNDSLTGSNLNDTIYGNGGNDELNGGNGCDTYIYNTGDGNDVINDSDRQGKIIYDSQMLPVGVYSGYDNKYVNMDMEEEYIYEWAGEGSDLIIKDSITVQNFHNGDLGIQLFGSSTAHIITGTSGDDFPLSGTLGDNIIYGGGGNDEIYDFASEGNDIIYGGTGNDFIADYYGNNLICGGSGNDTLFAGEGNDVFCGGKGNDDIYDGDGNDTYIFNIGDGQDIIKDRSGIDIIKFGAGISPNNNILVSVAGGDWYDLDNLYIRLCDAEGTPTGDKITIPEGIYYQSGIKYDCGVAYFEFNDGTVLSYEELLTKRDPVIEGAEENDKLKGSNLEDILRGNGGNDTIFAGNGNDYIEGNDGDDSIDGGDGDDVLYGNAGSDTLIGGAGDDELHNSAEEVNHLIGGIGNDKYYLDSDNNVLVENENEGIDTVISSVSHTLGDNFENLELTGFESINAIGNNEDNQLTGNSGTNVIYGYQGNDTIDGGAANDTMVGGLGDDVYYVDQYFDVITENAGEGTDSVYSTTNYNLNTNDNVENATLLGDQNINLSGNALNNVLTGNNGNNIIYGNNGNDTIDGGVGADTMQGGDGDDIYYVDNVNDVVTEFSNQGNDKIYASIDYTLANNVETLKLTGSATIATGNSGENIIIGNELNNFIYGESGLDTLYGGAGDDIIDGGLHIDLMIGGSGNDTYYVNEYFDEIIEDINKGTDLIYSTTHYNLSNTAANVENLVLLGDTNLNVTGNDLNNSLTGNAGNNIFYGNAGDDTIDGGIGADTMQGGHGDDVYYVDNVNDAVIEFSNQGNDKVISSIDYILANNVENLELTGSSNINGTGNSLDNSITGNTGNNSLYGAEGNDIYNFSIGSGIDTISDISGTADEISFDSTVSKSDIAIFQSGSDVYLDYGTTAGNDKITVIAQDTNTIERFELNNGEYLSNADVNNIISYIISYDAGDGDVDFTSVEDVKADSTLMAYIAGQWHS